MGHNPNSKPKGSASPAVDPQRQARQKKTLLVLGFALIAGGLVVLFALQRMPVPMRALAAFTDIIAGLVLLLVARQKF